MPLFLLHISGLLNSPECSHGSYLSSRLVKALLQGEEQFKDGQGGRGGRGGREGREPPLVPELEMGRDGQEYFGAWWLECEICKPCSASCVLFSAPTGVPACVQGDRRQSGKGGSVGMGSSWCHQVLVIAGKLASYLAHGLIDC